MRYEFFEHTADAKFRAYGKNLEEAFSNAAEAMFSVMVDCTKVKQTEEREISATGSDTKALLYNFLEELLFLLDSEGFFLHSVKSLKIKGNDLVATVIGDASTEDYSTHGDVKAVTYNEMEIEEKKGHCFVQVVVDV
ncbi:MAG: archease [Candidatus Woesearchaeota archaeon]